MALQIDYVYLEMIRTRSSGEHEVIAGLLKGIYEYEGDKFILLNGLKGSTEALSMEYYKFLSVEVLEQNFRNMTYLTSSDADQDTATKMVETLYEDLKAAKFEKREGSIILDIEKYKNVPKEYYEGKPIDAAYSVTASKTSGFGTVNTQRTHFQASATAAQFSKVTVPKADPEPAVLGRTTTKKPTKEVLEALSLLLDQVLTGQAVVELPPTVGDEKDVVSDTEALDDYYGASGRGFC